MSTTGKNKTKATGTTTDPGKRGTEVSGLSSESAENIKIIAEKEKENRKRAYQDSLKQFDLEKSMYALREESANLSKNTIKQHENISKYLQDEKKLEERKLHLLKSGHKFNEQEYKIIKDNLKNLKDGAQESLNTLKIAQRKNKLHQQQVPLQKKAADAQDALTERNEKYKQGLSASLDFLDEIDDALNDIPIVGGILSKALG